MTTVFSEFIDELRYDLAECSTTEDAHFVVKRASNEAIRLGLSTEAELADKVFELVWGSSAQTDDAIVRVYPNQFEGR